MDMFSLNDTGTDNEGNNIKDAIKMIFSLEPPVTLSEHIIEKDGIGKVVQTGEKVLLGKMSFQMVADELDMSSFKLVENENASPQTGIKINCDGLHYYYQQSTFRFADNRVVGSNDANLTNIIVSSGEKDENNPESSTYKEYEMSPKFNPETKRYEVELLENIDSLDIKAIKSDEKATMKIKVPKRDEEGNLAYEADGTTIVYEEKEMTSDVPIGVILNKLGEPDTMVSIIVTAEDGSLTNIYEVNIHRPYATIKGQAVLADFDDPDVIDNYLDLYGVELNHKVEVNLYETGLAEWESISDIFGYQYPDPFTYEKLEKIPKKASEISNNDGTYLMYVIPGKYDVQVTRLGFLDYIYVGVQLEEGDIVDMSTFNMVAGDANRDGIISQEDVVEISSLMDVDSSDLNFSEAANPTQTGTIMQEDLVYANKGQDLELQIIYF